MDDQLPRPPPSQTNNASHITLEPVPATVVAGNETRRREDNQQLGNCRSGCAEVDNHVLLGGLERGSVVGVSAEKEDFGVTVSFHPSYNPVILALIRICQLAVQFLAQGLHGGTLKTALVITPRPAGELLKTLRDGIRATIDASSDAQVKQHLDRVMLSCVFDIDGVWEVLADLDRPPSPSLEIQDSQDDDSPPPPQKKTLPDIIIITHVSSLLTSLFTHRSSPAAHSTLQPLSSHLRHLSRTLPSSPLILLLNSTSNPSGEAGSKPLDPTLRSVFNPPSVPGCHTALPRRNKPTFGLVFAQMLDVHVLCTRVPKTGADAEEVFGQHRRGNYVTVVEVLLDEMGVWEGRKRGIRRSREQRWGAVEVKNGRVVGAFVKGGEDAW